jgi:hypothetical protein
METPDVRTSRGPSLITVIIGAVRGGPVRRNFLAAERIRAVLRLKNAGLRSDPRFASSVYATTRASLPSKVEEQNVRALLRAF